jgi:hypothetical protein
MPERILRNAVRCRRCGTVIESTYRHDFKTCPCGAVSVDGGLDYLRRVSSREMPFDELSEVEGNVDPLPDAERPNSKKETD